jgi:hypothetical protein
MFITAWLVLLVGLLAAVLVNTLYSGTWGITGLIYAFLITLGTVSIAATLFWLAVAAQTQGTAKWYWALGMALLTSIVSIAGVVIIVMVETRQ